MDRHCNTPIEEIQVAVGETIFQEQTARLRQCLSYINKLEARKKEME